MNQGTKWVLLMQKNRRRKSHAWAPLTPVSNKYSATRCWASLIKAKINNSSRNNLRSLHLFIAGTQPVKKICQIFSFTYLFHRPGYFLKKLPIDRPIKGRMLQLSKSHVILIMRIIITNSRSRMQNKCNYANPLYTSLQKILESR